MHWRAAWLFWCWMVWREMTASEEKLTCDAKAWATVRVDHNSLRLVINNPTVILMSCWPRCQWSQTRLLFRFSKAMMSRTFVFLCLLSMLQAISGFSSLDVPLKNSRTSSIHSNSRFQRVLTLRGGDAEEEASTSKSSSPMALSALIMAGAQSYSKYLESYPIATKSVTACFIFAASDTLAQMIEGKKSFAAFCCS